VSITDLALAVALALIRRFEGFRPRPYLCPAGVPSIGYGSTRYLDGRAVQLTDPPISREAAERLLLVQVRRTYLPAVLALCPGVSDPNHLAALIDFAYNLGAGNLSASTLRRKVNANDWKAAAVEFLRWVRGGGRMLPGLVKRRQAEVALL